MKRSQLLLSTLKDAPKDAQIASHQLLLRGGYVQQVAAGLYSFMPLGLRVLKNIETIIREQLDAAGCQECLLPLLTPAQLWQESGRWDAYGPELLRLSDRHEQDYCLGPTFEEAMTDLVKRSLKSYKQLPVTVYQMQLKFRDEIRPRFGLMRSREFMMKDAYSFHMDKASLAETYSRLKNVYFDIFKRCGLDAICVAADSGAMGGDESAEFMVTAKSGEDTVLRCSSCDYVCNEEVLGKSKGCPSCKGADTLLVERGIEVGHIFQLGQKYSQAMSLTVLNEGGDMLPLEMGCYGIGVSRVMAAAIEQHHDEKGIIWPMAIAPYKVSLLVTQVKDDALREAAERLYVALQSRGISVLYDDRPVSPGVKFNDADLLGMPIQLLVGRSFKDENKIECQRRGQDDKVTVQLDDVLEWVVAEIEGSLWK